MLEPREELEGRTLRARKCYNGAVEEWETAP